MINKCVLCNNTKKVKLFDADSPDAVGDIRYQLVECIGCKLVSVEKVCGCSNKELYFPEYYGKNENKSSVFRIFENYFVRCKANKIENYLKGETILDIGCGNGSFLMEMHKRKWKVYGVEPFDKIRETLPDELKNTVVDDLMQMSSPGYKFDVITLWHVFEHIGEPVETLKLLNQLLKKNGLLFIAIPNFSSLESMIGKEKWFHLDLPRHVFHYTPATANKMIESSGFHIVQVDHFSWEYNIYGMFQTLFNVLGLERNFIYNKFKRGVNYRKLLSARKYVLNLVCFYLLTPIVLVFSLILALISGILKKSGSMEIYSSI